MARGCTVGLVLVVLALWPAAASSQTATTETSPTFTVAIPPPEAEPAPAPSEEPGLTQQPSVALADTGFDSLLVMGLGLWVMLFGMGLRLACREEHHCWPAER